MTHDSDVERELTVSGIISAVLYTNSNSSTARAYEPEDAVFLTLRDNSGYVLIRIEIEPDKMVLGIDDGSAQIDVLCHTERRNISIGDEVVVEGEFLRNMIYAFAIQVQK